MKAVIAGANARTAQLLIPLLLQRGHSVTGLVRRPQQTAALQAQGVEPVLLDLAQAGIEDFRTAFTGADVVIWAAGGDPVTVDRDAAIRAADATATGGVRRYVSISTMGAGLKYIPGMGTYLRCKGQADDAVRGIDGLDWTIIRPGWLSDGAPTGKVSIKRPGFLAFRPIPRADVAAVVAEAVEQPGPSRHAIFGVISGPTPVADAIAGLPG